MRIIKKILAIFITSAMLLAQMPVAFAAGSSEQFSLTTGDTYYFDLSAQKIIGTVITALPDTSLKWVPFTYAGTVNAYSRTSAGVSDEENVTVSKRSLFVSDYPITNKVCWTNLNIQGFIFGRDYNSGGVSYKLRSLSVGSYGGYSSITGGYPASNEWDQILDKNFSYIKNADGILDIMSFGQDTNEWVHPILKINSSCSVRGNLTGGGARDFAYGGMTFSEENRSDMGFRPALEIPNPDTLGNEGLKTVTFDMGTNGTLGNKSLTTAKVVYTGSLTLPEITPENGFNYTGAGTGSLVWYAGSELYRPGTEVTLDHGTVLRAGFDNKCPEQFNLATGKTYYFDLSAQNVPGLRSDKLPDTSLKWVPFTYAGTIEAYSLDESSSGNTAASDNATQSERNLFVADYNITTNVTWTALNAGGFIFGKNYSSGGISYSLRSLSVGNNRIVFGDNYEERGLPDNNEWNRLLDKDIDNIKNTKSEFAWGQDTSHISKNYRAVSGWFSWYHLVIPSSIALFRPALEILNSDTLGADSLKTVTYDMGSLGTLGNKTLTSATVVYTGELTLPTTAESGFNFTCSNEDKLRLGWCVGSKFYKPGETLTIDSGTILTLGYGIPPTITGPTEMTLIEGYSDTSTDAYTIVGSAPVTVTKIYGDDRITWNNKTKKLDIAAGIPAGSRVVTLRVTNGIQPDMTLEFALLVKPVPVYNAIAFPQNGYSFHAAKLDYAEQGAKNFIIRSYATAAITSLKASLTDGSEFEISEPLTRDTLPICGDEASVQVRPKTGLSTGIHTDTLNFTGNNGLSVKVALSFEVGETYTAVVTPTDHNFNAVTEGYAEQAEQNFIIWGTGSGTITGLRASLTDESGFEISDPLTSESILEDGTAAVKVRPKTGLSAGIHKDTLKITGDNGLSASAEISFTVVARPVGAPIITGPTTLTLTEGYSAIATDAYSITGTAPVTVTKTSGDAKITWDDATKKLNIAAGLTVGSYPVVLTAHNGISPSATQKFTLTVKQDPDIAIVDAAKAAIVDGSVNVDFGATQVDKTAAVQTYVNGIIGNIANAAGVTATVTYDSGNQYNVALSKGSASDSKSITMTVNEAGPVTVDLVTIKTAPTQTTYTAGDSLDLAGLVITLHKSDSSTEVVAFADFATKGITTTPTNGTGLSISDTTVIITYTADSKSVSQNITVVPALSNHAPTAKSIVPTQNMTVGSNASFTAADIAEDEDSDALTVTSIVTVPDSTYVTASLNSGAVTVTGVAAGSTSITVTVSDGKGGTVNVTVPIEVTAAADVEISIIQSPIKTILNAITFGLFFDDTLDVSISCTDTVDHYEYQTVADGDTFDENSTWTQDDSFSIIPDFKGRVYARSVYGNGTASAYTVRPLVVDKTKPTISASYDASTGSIEVSVTDSGAGIEKITYQVGTDAEQTINLEPSETLDITTQHSFTINSLPDGNYNAAINASDNSGNAAATKTVPVGQGGTAPTINTNSLSGGTVGSPYSQALAATGDTPITWSIIGDLPNGLTLNGSTISGTPTTRGTFSFTVKATNSEDDDTKALSIYISSASSGNDGGNNGGGSSGSSSITPTIAPDKKPDQPVIATSPLTPTVDANGKTTITVPQQTVVETINKAIAEAAREGRSANGIGVSMETHNPAGTKSLGIVLTQPVLKLLTDSKVRQFEVDGGLFTLDYDLEALNQIRTQSTGDVTVTITPATGLSEEAKTRIGTRTVYNITLRYVKDGKTVNITSLNRGSVTLSIPYTPGKNEAVGYLFGVYVDGNGKATRIDGSTYDANSKSVIFDSNHFSVYGVGYTAPSADFTDTSTHWAKESIDYVVGRGLLAGTSDTTFSPDTSMTRGMLITALGRLARVDTKAYTTNSFTDVNADSLYRPYIEWAYKKGIIQGIGSNQFVPDRAITREEIAVIIANFAKATGYTLPVTREATTYADASGIGSTYKTAGTAMQQAGIMMGGTSNKFNPKSNATRAEVSSMLGRYIKLTIDPNTAQGWTLNDAGQYLYYKDSKALTGTETIDGVKYFFNTDGTLKTGWVKDGDNWRFYSGKTMLVGWWDLGENGNNKTYCFAKDGLMVSGKWLEIDGKWYYFYTDGSLARSTTIDGYKVDENGTKG